MRPLPNFDFQFLRAGIFLKNPFALHPPPPFHFFYNFKWCVPYQGTVMQKRLTIAQGVHIFIFRIKTPIYRQRVDALYICFRYSFNYFYQKLQLWQRSAKLKETEKLANCWGNANMYLISGFPDGWCVVVLVGVEV